jgi:hypothetical protein
VHTNPETPTASVVRPKIAWTDFILPRTPPLHARAIDGRPSGSVTWREELTMPLNGSPAAPTHVVMRSPVRAHQRHHVIRRFGGFEPSKPATPRALPHDMAVNSIFLFVVRAKAPRAGLAGVRL